jgi:hypothetical protein
MRTSQSLAPYGPDQDTYIVLDDFGRASVARDRRRCHCRETLIRNLLSGGVQQSGSHRRLQHSRRLVP